MALKNVRRCTDRSSCGFERSWMLPLDTAGRCPFDREVSVRESARDSDLALAHRLGDVAGHVSLSYFRRELRSWSKSDGSLATEADVAVEDALRAQLAIERPGDAVLGEE